MSMLVTYLELLVTMLLLVSHNGPGTTFGFSLSNKAYGFQGTGYMISRVHSFALGVPGAWFPRYRVHDFQGIWFCTRATGCMVSRVQGTWFPGYMVHGLPDAWSPGCMVFKVQGAWSPG